MSGPADIFDTTTFGKYCPLVLLAAWDAEDGVVGKVLDRIVAEDPDGVMAAEDLRM